MTHASPAPHRFVVLDGLRGLAAFFIVADHVPSVAIGPLTPGRYLAVDFFFILSGFVISYAYGQRLASGMTPLDFIKARLIRFYPLYLAATILGALITYYLILKDWRNEPTAFATTLALNLAFLPALPAHAVNLFPFNGPSWSLFFELFINIVYAFIAVWLTASRLVLLILLSIPALVLAVFHAGGDGGFQWTNIEAGAARVTFGFFAGVMIHRLRDHWRPAARPAWLAFAALTAIFMVPIPAEGTWRPVFDLFAMIVLFPVLVIWAAEAKAGPRALQLFAWMGLLSYGVYIFQVPVRDYLELALGAGLGMPLAALGDGAVIAVLILSALVTTAAHTLYDAPIRRRLKRSA